MAGLGISLSLYSCYMIGQPRKSTVLYLRLFHPEPPDDQKNHSQTYQIYQHRFLLFVRFLRGKQAKAVGVADHGNGGQRHGRTGDNRTKQPAGQREENPCGDRNTQ